MHRGGVAAHKGATLMKHDVGATSSGIVGSLSLHRVKKPGRARRTVRGRKNPKGIVDVYRTKGGRAVDFYRTKGGRVGVDICAPGPLAAEMLAVMLTPDVAGEATRRGIPIRQKHLDEFVYSPPRDLLFSQLDPGGMALLAAGEVSSPVLTIIRVLAERAGVPVRFD